MVTHKNNLLTINSVSRPGGHTFLHLIKTFAYYLSSIACNYELDFECRRLNTSVLDLSPVYRSLTPVYLAAMCQTYIPPTTLGLETSFCDHINTAPVQRGYEFLNFPSLSPRIDSRNSDVDILFANLSNDETSDLR